MPVAINDILEYTIQSTLYNQRVMTVLHFRVFLAMTDTNPITNAATFLTRVAPAGPFDLITGYRALISSDLTVNFHTAQYINPVRYVRQLATLTLGGTVASTSLTANTSAVISKTCQIAGRSNRGNIHIPGVPSNSYTSGSVIAGYLANMQTWANLTLAPITEGGAGGAWQQVIFHRNPAAPTRFTDVFAMQPQATMRVMRRRTVGVGK